MKLNSSIVLISSLTLSLGANEFCSQYLSQNTTYINNIKYIECTTGIQDKRDYLIYERNYLSLKRDRKALQRGKADINYRTY